MKPLFRYLATAAVVALAIAIAAAKYWDYLVNPWTRDGQVMAQVVQIAPRVSGPIVQLPIVDNQFVKAGDLLFEIDPRTFAVAVDNALAKLDQTRDEIDALQDQVSAAEASVEDYTARIDQSASAVKQADASLFDAQATYDRVRPLAEAGTVSRQRLDNATATLNGAIASKAAAEASLLSARAALRQVQADLAQAQATLGAPGAENAQLRSAFADAQTAQLNLEFTQVTAPVDGYVTNLNLRLGSQAVANQPTLALVDVNSYWIAAYMRETTVANVRAGDRAVVTLMSYPDRPLEGRVDSLGWGIAVDDGSTGFNLLPNVAPTFEWIRLAQRVPVRVVLDTLPDGVELRIGNTASVLVMTGTAGSGDTTKVPPAPRALQ